MRRFVAVIAFLAAMAASEMVLAAGFTNATSQTNSTSVYFCTSGCTGTAALNGSNGTLSVLDTVYSIMVSTNGTLTSGTITMYGDNGCGQYQALSGTIDATNPQEVRIESAGWTKIKFVPANFSGNVGFTVNIRSR